MLLYLYKVDILYIMMADKSLEYTFMFFFLPVSQRGTFSVTSYMLSWRRKLSKRDLNIKELDQVGANSFFYELNPTEKGCNMKTLVLILKCQKIYSYKIAKQNVSPKLYQTENSKNRR